MKKLLSECGNSFLIIIIMIQKRVSIFLFQSPKRVFEIVFLLRFTEVSRTTLNHSRGDSSLSIAAKFTSGLVTAEALPVVAFGCIS